MQRKQDSVYTSSLYQCWMYCCTNWVNQAAHMLELFYVKGHDLQLQFQTVQKCWFNIQCVCLYFYHGKVSLCWSVTLKCWGLKHIAFVSSHIIVFIAVCSSTSFAVFFLLCLQKSRFCLMPDRHILYCI